MAANPKGKNVRIGPDGRIYIGDQPSETPSDKSSAQPESGTTTTIGPDGRIYIESQQGGGSSGGQQPPRNNQRQPHASDDSEIMGAALIFAFVGAIAAYFASPDPTWVTAVIGACLGAFCALLPRVSAVAWGGAAVIGLIAVIVNPIYTFFQVSLPIAALFALLACLGILMWRLKDEQPEDWIAGVAFFVGLACFALSIGWLQFDYETPLIGGAYSQLIAAKSDDETGAAEFVSEYYTNVVDESESGKSPRDVKNWDKRVRAYLEPGSPAQRKFDSSDDSGGWFNGKHHGPGFPSLVKKVTAKSSPNDHVVNVSVTYLTAEAPEHNGDPNRGISHTATVACTMSDSHFVHDYEWTS